MAENAFLVKLSGANEMLVEAKTLLQVKQVIAVAEAAKTYAKFNKMSLDSINYAGEISLLGYRKLGVVLAETPKNEGTAGRVTGPGRGKNGGAIVEPPFNAPPTLAEIGITKKESAAAQKIAAVPEDTLTAIIAKVKESGKEVTTATVMREVSKGQRGVVHAAKVERQFATGTYGVIYADPPWRYNDSGLDEYGHAERHYPTMSIDELCKLPVQTIVAKDAALFLWVTSPLLEECFKVIKAWGFTYKTSFVWDKVKHNFGHYNSVRHEFLLVCTRGSYTPEAKQLFDSVVTVERTKEHSEKPSEFRTIIETLYPSARRIELFARGEDCPGWDQWGNE